jgi:hypothetical protein
MKFRYLSALAAAAGLILCSATSAQADIRLFSYTYQATPVVKNEVEMENWVTWKTTRLKGNNEDQFEFRHEFEWGVTDRLQLSLYVADWSYRPNGPDQGSTYDNAALEVIYNLTNPNTSFLGSSIYGELTLGEHEAEIEGKLLLQKNLGKLVLAYNVGLEAGWEGEKFGHWNDETTGEFAQVLGASYEVTPHFTVGAEVLNEIEWPEWSQPESPRVFAGPNASVSIGRFYATVTPLFQLTQQRTEPDLQTRLIVGFSF